MQSQSIKTHTDGIWISAQREIEIIKQFNQAILKQKFLPVTSSTINYGFPYIYHRDHQTVHCRLVDSVFLLDPEAWTRKSPNTIITDNIPLAPVSGHIISVVPEFWSIWRFDPIYTQRPATNHYNCFMNRPRGDRSIVFYELIKRNMLSQGSVSYNVNSSELEQEFVNAELNRYSSEHKVALGIIPYNTLHETLEQCIIDSRVGLVLETYISDSHIVFSEKIFRALQIPRPWLLYCSHKSIEQLRKYGFDVLDDYVDHSYDHIVNPHDRLINIIDQLETFANCYFGTTDYQRFNQAACHNQKLLNQLALTWPTKFQEVIDEIEQL